MAATEEILGQFLGDDDVPGRVGLRGREGPLLGLRRPALPAPGQPDVLRHRRLVAELRPHVPPLRHAVRGRLARQERQRLRLHGRRSRPTPTCASTRTEYSARYGARVPRDAGVRRRRWAPTSTPSCRSTAEHFADWWRDRLRPEMERNFAFLEARLDARRRHGPGRARRACSRTRSTSTTATGRSTGCSTSPSCRRRSTCARSWRRRAAAVDEALLGRLQNSASDRNWDSIEALWRMKNEVRDDAGAARRLRGRRRRARSPRRCASTERGRRFIAERIEPYQREFGWHAVWSHEFIFPTVPRADGAGPRAGPRLPRRPTTTTRRRSRRCAATSRPPSREILDGLTGDALEEMRAANAVNLRMAPLTPDHHFYIDQGANAHVRLVLHRDRPEAGRGRPRSTQPDDVMFLRYNELRALIGERRRRSTRAALVADAPGRARGGRTDPAARLGRHGHADAARLPVPRQLGLPGAVPPGAVATTSARSPGIGGVAGRRRGHRPGRPRRSTSSTRSRDGDILVCQMTNPAWVVLFTKIAGLVTDTGGTTSHPAVLAREFGIPAVDRHVRRDAADRDRRPDPGRRDAGRVEILRERAVGRGAPRRPPRSGADGRPMADRRRSSRAASWPTRSRTGCSRAS